MTSRIETLIHNAYQLELTPISGKQLWEKQDELLGMQLTPEFQAKEKEILAKYELTLEEWPTILARGSAWWGWAGKTEHLQCSNEIKALCRENEVHNPCYTRSYLYACLSSSLSKHVQREKIGGLWHYRWVG